MEFSLIIDALIAVLLVATIAYAAVLNRKLTVLRDGKSDMAALIASFSESAERAGNGIETLKQAAGRSGEDLQRKVEAARGLVDDLGFLIEKGTRLAERLDAGVSGARAKPAPDLATARAPAPQKKAEPPAVAVDNAEIEPEHADGEPGKPPGEKAAPNAGAADLSAAESELLKALQGMR